MKLYELMEVLAPDVIVNVKHAVTGKYIGEPDYNEGWIIILIRVIKKNMLEVSVI